MLQTGTDVSFSTDLAWLHFVFLLFLLKHQSQDRLTPHGKSLAATKLWKPLPRAASDSVPRGLGSSPMTPEAIVLAAVKFFLWLVQGCGSD